MSEYNNEYQEIIPLSRLLRFDTTAYAEKLLKKERRTLAELTEFNRLLKSIEGRDIDQKIYYLPITRLPVSQLRKILIAYKASQLLLPLSENTITDFKGVRRAAYNKELEQHEEFQSLGGKIGADVEETYDAEGNQDFVLHETIFPIPTLQSQTDNVLFFISYSIQIAVNQFTWEEPMPLFRTRNDEKLSKNASLAIADILGRIDYLQEINGVVKEGEEAQPEEKGIYDVVTPHALLFYYLHADDIEKTGKSRISYIKTYCNAYKELEPPSLAKILSKNWKGYTGENFEKRPTTDQFKIAIKIAEEMPGNTSKVVEKMTNDMKKRH